MAYTPDPHLSFNQPRATDAHLTFGAADAPVSAVGTCTVSVKLPALRVSVLLAYDNQVQRGLSPSFSLPVQVATFCSRGVGQPTQVASVLATQRTAGLAVGVPLGNVNTQVIGTKRAMRRALTTQMQPAASLGSAACAVVQAGVRYVMERMDRWQAASAITRKIGLGWQAMYRRQLVNAEHCQMAQALVAQRHLPNHLGRPLNTARAERYQQAWPPRPGKSWRDPGIIPPGPLCYERSAHLTFKWPAAIDGHLTFICDNSLAPGEPLQSIPIQRSYIVMNTVTLQRVDDDSFITAKTFSIGIDADSWTWSWDAEIDASNIDAVMAGTDGSPVDLRATINGSQFLLLAERVSRDRSFGKSSLKVSGRGISARLAAPYYAKVSMRNDVAMDMEQIAEAALMHNGVGIGWTLDWRAADWLVPAGLWAANATPIEALLMLAESAGAYVQPARSSRVLRVLPRYPVAPWEWASTSPALQIPDSVFLTESIEWVEKARYNAVYVSGQGVGGVLGLAKRSGTSGDVLAQMISDPLVTDELAVRARGVPILADTGRQELVSGTMPVLDGVGIVDVGTLVQLGSGSNARRGLVRSVKVSVGLPRVRQTLEVECHG